MILKNCCLGQKFKLLNFGQAPVSYRRKLLAMGLTCGVVVTIEHIAPLGDPSALNVRGAILVLRQVELNDLGWERV
jgi:ferrous iron transport protein A